MWSTTRSSRASFSWGPGRCSSDAHARYRPTGRPVQEHDSDRRDLPGRLSCHLRPSSAQRLRERIPDLPGVLQILFGCAPVSLARPRAPRYRGIGPHRRAGAACFTKAFGIIFLGEPRDDEARAAHECGSLMRTSMILLGAACVLGGLAGPLLVSRMSSVIASITMMPETDIAGGLAAGTESLRSITIFGLGFLLLAGALAALRRWLLAGRRVVMEGTWDCGFSKPTARMQYTASSFAQPILRMFGFLRLSRRQFTRPAGLLPSEAEFATRTPDVFKENLWRPAFAGVGGLLSRVRPIQHGRIQLYVLYVVLTLLALLLWRLQRNHG